MQAGVKDIVQNFRIDMINEWLGHPTFMYDTFSSKIIELNGEYYAQEDWQWGEIWSEEESYGSVLYDLKNRRKLSLGCYFIQDENEWLDFIDKRSWEKMDEFEDKMYQDAIDYYLGEIQKLKQS